MLFQSMSAPLIVHRSRQHLVLAGNDTSNISAAMDYDAKDTCGLINIIIEPVIRSWQ